MSDALLRTEGLAVGYGAESVVSDIALRAEPGTVLCLIGPNGAGKSTILKTLIRELKPTAGAVLLENRRLESYREQELARVSAAVLTGRPEPELMRCEEVAAIGRYPYTGRLGILSDEDRKLVRESMELVGVLSLAEQDFRCVSDGQRQRVLLARALCQEPRLLILDEPTSFLDIRHKLDFLELLRTLVRERRLAVIMSMHELELAQRYSDLLVCVRDGRIDRIGPPEEIFREGYIETLYGIEKGSYSVSGGTVEPLRVESAPRVFVIGGGGSGIPVYRQLRRLRIPFAAGVLPENDLDVPAARAMASVLITDRPYEKVSAERVAEAAAVLERCEAVVCTAAFGEVNRENRRLEELARERGLLCGAEALRARFS